jgi:prophage antirepressor-like protein
MTTLINSIDLNLKFNENTVRVLGTSENPMFIVKDICNILEIKNISHATSKLPEKYKGLRKNDTLGGKQNILVVNEAGLYHIVMRSNKPLAQPFQEWVYEEVLPSIRIKGEYKLEEYKKILDDNKQELEDNKKALEDKDEKIKKLEKKYIKKPKEVFEEKNVVYLMTSEEGEKVGEYIIGKSKDLSNRKESYNNNKLHDFKVIYYISCKDTKFMDIIESVVLMKFEKYRCKAGRDVFLLPNIKEEITSYTNIFDKCLKFYEEVDDAIYPTRTIVEDKDRKKVNNKKYQEENKEKIKKDQQSYYADNKEILSDIKKKYYEENSDEITVKNKKYYEENKEAVIEIAMKYYTENKEEILVERKEFYKDNKEHILEERKEYYKENYKTKIATQRKKKETCECGMIVSHYCMKKHKTSARHKNLLEKLSITERE